MMAEQVTVYTAIGEGESFEISKAGTSYGSKEDFISAHKSRGRLIEKVSETRAGLELRVFEAVISEVRYFADSQIKELETYLTEVRDFKMNKVAKLMNKKKYTEKLFTKPDEIHSYKRKATLKYYEMQSKTEIIEDFRPLKIEIKTVSDLLLW